MKVLGVILARGGSVGVPRKNIRLLGGEPLVAWTIEAAQGARLIDHLVGSTDDAEIKGVFDAYGLPVVMVDTVPSNRTRMVHLWQAIDGFGGSFDVIADLHADCPFKTSQDIDAAINLIKDADSVIGITEMGANHPARAKRLDENGYIQDFCVPEPVGGMRQSLKPKAYIRAGGLYIYRREAIAPPNGKLFGHARSIGYELPARRAVNIDTELDFLMAQAML